MLPPKLPKKAKRDSRWRSPAHRAWVRSHGCSVKGCDEVPIECAHVRIGTDGGMGLKPSDQWCISLCVPHHNRQHAVGELSFQTEYDIDMKALALEFFNASPHRHKFR